MSIDIVDIRINFMPANTQPVRSDRHTCPDCETQGAHGRDSFGDPMPCVRCALVRLVKASQADMADPLMRGRGRRPHSMKQTENSESPFISGVQVQRPGVLPAGSQRQESRP
jgi:hypothetical protein